MGQRSSATLSMQFKWGRKSTSLARLFEDDAVAVGD